MIHEIVQFTGELSLVEQHFITAVSKVKKIEADKR